MGCVGHESLGPNPSGSPHLPRNAVIGQAQEIGPLAAPSAGRLEATAPLHCGLARIALRGLTYRGRRSRGVGQSDVARFGCTRTLGACLPHDPRTGSPVLPASRPCGLPSLAGSLGAITRLTLLIQKPPSGLRQMGHKRKRSHKPRRCRQNSPRIHPSQIETTITQCCLGEITADRCGDTSSF